jgi:restriction system protein
MSDNLLQIGKPEANYNAAETRVLKYTLEMSHLGLKKHKLISAPDIEILRNKANLQSQKWDEAWQMTKNKMESSAMTETSANNAMRLTREAERAIADIENLLLHTLDIDDAIDWDRLKRKDDFPEKSPVKPSKPKTINYPAEPDVLRPVYTFFEKIITKRQKTKEYDAENKRRMEKWNAEKLDIDKKTKRLTNSLTWQQNPGTLL